MVNLAGTVIVAIKILKCESNYEPPSAKQKLADSSLNLGQGGYSLYQR